MWQILFACMKVVLISLTVCPLSNSLQMNFVVHLGLSEFRQKNQFFFGNENLGCGCICPFNHHSHMLMRPDEVHHYFVNALL